MTDPNIVINPNGKTYIENDYSKTHYLCNFYCSNCSKQTGFLLPKGVRMKGLTMDCPRCGCEETL